MSVAALDVANKAKSAKKPLNFVRFNEHQNCVFLWPWMFIPIILNPLLAWGLIDAKTAAWFALSVMAISLAAATIKLERMLSYLLVAGLIIVGVSVLAAEGWKIPVLTWIGNTLRAVTPQYEAYFGGWLGGIGLFFFLFSQGHAFYEGRWKFGRNGFENIKVGRGGGVKPRAGRSVSYDFGDPLKRFFGFGAGNVTVSLGERVEYTLYNVFFLSRRTDLIDKILASVSTVHGDEEAVIAETHI